MNDDARALAELAKISDLDASHTIVHFIYLPHQEAAYSTADSLSRQNFLTETRMSADGVNWLVLVKHEAIPSEELLASMRQFLELLAAEVGGEYDGWEAAVHRRSGETPGLH